MINELEANMVMQAVMKVTGVNMSLNVQSQVLKEAREMLQNHRNRNQAQKELEAKQQESTAEDVMSAIEEVAKDDTYTPGKLTIVPKDNQESA